MFGKKKSCLWISALKKGLETLQQIFRFSVHYLTEISAETETETEIFRSLLMIHKELILILI